MVETVSAQPPAAAQGTAVTALRLEPGTELKARVEANLPGGVVRFAADDAKFDLKLPVRLPPGSDVIVTVSGNKANPVIQVTTPQVLPGEPAPPVAAQQPQQAPQPSQALPGSPTPGQVQAPATNGTGVPVGTQAAQSAPTQLPAQANPVPLAAPPSSRPSVQGPPAQQAAAPKSTAAQQAVAPARQSVPPTASTPQVASSAAQDAVKASRPDPVAAGARPQSGAGSSAPLPPVAARPGAAAPAPAASVQGSAGSVSQPAAPAPALTSVSTQLQAPAPPTQPGLPVSGRPAATPGPQAPLQQAGDAVRQMPLPAPASPAPAPGTASAAVPPGNADPRPAAPVPQANPVPGALAQSAPQASPQPAAPQPATTGTAPPATPATPAPAAAGAMPNSSQAPQAAPSPVSGSGAAQSSVQVRAAAGPPLPGADRPSSAPGPLSGTGISAAKPGVLAAEITPSPARAPANAAATAAPAQAAPVAQSKGAPQAGESLRVAQNQPYLPSNSGTAQHASGRSSPNAAAEAKPASQVARQAFQALGEQQSGLGNLFAQVGNLMTAQATGKVSLPDPVVKAMQQILGLRLNPGQIPSSDDIQQSIRMSGQFREANAALPRGSTPGAQADLKSVLMSFRSLLQQFGAEAQVARPAAQPKPPSRHDSPQPQTQPGGRGFLPGSTPQILQAMLKETDAALARVRMTQLVNTGLAGDDRAQATSRPMDFVLELPLALGQETGILQMQVGRDGSGQGEEDDKEPAWRLRFAMDLTATGPVEAAVSLRGGGTYVSLWVDRPATFEGLKALEETMLASFADAGLDLQEFRLMRGLPPKAAARYGTLVDRQS